jgi:hypothetical protein
VASAALAIARTHIAASRAALAGIEPPEFPVALAAAGPGSGVCECCGVDLVAGFLVRFSGQVPFEICGACLPDLVGGPCPDLYDLDRAER